MYWSNCIPIVVLWRICRAGLFWRESLKMSCTDYPQLASHLLPPSHTAFHVLRTTMDVWHRRLGHPHESVLKRLVSVFQLPVTNKNVHPVCEPCQLGKSRRLPFSSTHVVSRSCFELVYADVWGPASTNSIYGNKYFVQFVDDHSKFCWIYFLT